MQRRNLLSLEKEPFQEDPRSSQLLITCKIASAQYSQASLPREMLLEGLLSYGISNVLLPSTDRHSRLLFHEPPTRQPPALLPHRQQRADET